MTLENITKTTVLNKLSTQRFQGDMRVLYDGTHIGKIVRYGRAVGFARSRVKTVYGSRIYGKVNGVSVSIEEEAGSERSLLEKVAAALARKLKAQSAAPLQAADVRPTSSNDVPEDEGTATPSP